MKERNLSPDMIEGVGVDLDDHLLLGPFVFSMETVAYLKDNPDGQVYHLLKECHHLYHDFDDKRRQRFNEIIAQRPEAERKQLAGLLELEHWPSCRKEGSQYVIELSGNQLFSCELILENYESDIPADHQGIPIAMTEMTKEENSYLLKASFFDPVSAAEKNGSISFDDFKVQTRVYNGLANRPIIAPWSYLLDFFRELTAKAEIMDVNEKESGLLPIARELILLNDDEVHMASHTMYTYPQLRKLLEERSAAKILKTLDKIESHYSDSVVYSTSAENLLSLDMQGLEYYPVWQQLYQQARESQQDYPARYACDYGETARQVLEENGFSHCGDDYRTAGKLKGLHYFGGDSFDVVGFQKVEHYVRIVPVSTGVEVYGNLVVDCRKNHPDFFSTMFAEFPGNHLLSYLYRTDEESFDREAFASFLRSCLSAFRLEKLTDQQRQELNIETTGKQPFRFGAAFLLSFILVGFLYLFGVVVMVAVNLFIKDFSGMGTFLKEFLLECCGITFISMALFYVLYLLSNKDPR
ncbi:MAG: hypothetical protein J5887_06355 [Erysipelotrichaceae bacterium]|nr:hypothetical protein [Erysipelotrichaceae bacterium]